MKIASLISMSQSEWNLVDALYDLYDEVGYSWKTDPVEITHEVDVNSEFRLNNAYDVYVRSAIRNDISDHITANINSIVNGNVAAMSALTALINAALGLASIDLQINVIIKFPDGSQALWSLESDLYPEHHPEDSRNRDHENQEIVNDGSSGVTGVYAITSGGHYNDFVNASGGAVTFIGSSSGGGGTMQCVLKGNILTCIFTPK
ncbi:MAG: hypothetical protein ACJAS9_001113 [Polaribacter sp.]|jgi:hypothetical protein